MVEQLVLSLALRQEQLALLAETLGCSAAFVVVVVDLVAR